MKPKITKENSCDGKTGYDSKPEAIQAAIRHNDLHKHRLESYHCGTCNKYHFGHSVKARRIKQPNKQRRDKKKIDPKTIDYNYTCDQNQLLSIRFS